MKKILFFFALSIKALAQTDTTAVDDFSEYGDADDKKIKTFCTQKVLYLSPTRFISVGYELQTPFDISSSNVVSSAKPLHSNVSSARGLRLAFNTPVISRSNFILSLGLTYWNTSFDRGHHTSSSEFKTNLFENGLRTTGVNATIFKPLNDKNFLIFQGNADLNGTYRNLNEINSKQMTYSAAAIYGWKKSDNLMWGIGAARTYRLGELIYVPVFMYNRTFNPKWGLEVLLPSRAAVRRNFGTTSMLLLGYELEGNTYYLGENNGYLRRGEIKPRISYERQIKNFIWLSAQAGMRVNGRFNVFSTQNPAKNELAIISNTLQNPFYFNISLNLVSP
ncbi:MAG: DUF6268 family outer membrane beta-barrel protein [Spirosomataceae bacterium]